MARLIIDASVLIAYKDPEDAKHADALAFFSRHQADELTIPASVYAEVLVHPIRLGARQVREMEETIADLGIAVAPLTRAMGRRAAEIRARYGKLGLADAFVIATGDVLDQEVATADASWRKISPRVMVI